MEKVSNGPGIVGSVAADSVTHKIHWLYKVIGVFMALAAFVTVMLGSILVVSQDRGFYGNEFDKLGTTKYVGMSDRDLQQVTESVLVYLSEPNPAKVSNILEIEATVRGEWRQVFNEREITHMVDVRGLYWLDVWVCCILIGVLIVLVSFLVFQLRRRRGDGTSLYVLKRVVKGFWLGSIILLGIFVFLAIGSFLDFDEFFTILHEVLYTNDLWLLDPTKDVLCQIMQGELFSDMIFRIIVITGLVWLVISCGVGVGQFILRKRQRLRRDIG